LEKESKRGNDWEVKERAGKVGRRRQEEEMGCTYFVSFQ
jgi:hypothetical protein